MPKTDYLSARILKGDAQIRKWWGHLTSHEASKELRKAVDFYLKYSKYNDVLQLLQVLQIDPQDAIQRLNGMNSITKTLVAQPLMKPSIEPINNLGKRVDKLLDD